MLAELEIENLAVISHARIDFSPHLNVFTGETGAGKSILIHGIHAVLGQRVTRDLVRTGCDKATVTALFTHLEPLVCQKLDEMGIAHEEDELLLSREIASDGGSIARVNGHTTTVSVLRELGDTLITIHGQHDSQALLSPECHLAILDAYGGDDTLLHAYQDAFHQLQKTAKQLNRLVKSEKKDTQHQQALQQFLEDTDALDLQLGEEDALEADCARLQRAEDLRNAVRTAYLALDGNCDTPGATSAVDQIRDAMQALQPYTDLQTEFQSICDRLESVSIEVQDLAETCAVLQDTVREDPEELEQKQTRLREIHRLCRKYNCADGDDLVHRRASAQQEMQASKSNAEEIRALTKEKETLLEQVTALAKELSQYREDTLTRFTRDVTEQLEFLNMPNVVLTGKHTMGKLTVQGMDNLEFMISANAGEEPRPLAKIASGGELSRIMLALKCVIADRDGVPTLIFDEIDAGVSGKAAQKIGMKLREVSAHHQVLCVTHLSQIAVMADRHLLIEKEVIGDRTETEVTALDTEGRVREIARIMGGDHPSDLVLQTAAEELRRWQSPYAEV